MNKELCIKVGKWNNSILWWTVEKKNYIENNLCITLVIYQESLRDALSINVKKSDISNLGVWYYVPLTKNI